MANNITKPNIYFYGDKRLLKESVVGEISKFSLSMSHAKDSMYYEINDSSKNTIEILINPSDTDDKHILTNYIIFSKSFKDKTISFKTIAGYDIYYVHDFFKAVFNENTIVTIQHIDSNKIVVGLNSISAKKPEPITKYGVLLTLYSESGETVYYTNPNDNIDLSGVNVYWDYNPATGELGPASELDEKNSHVYNETGEHYLVVTSDNDLKFPGNLTESEAKNTIANNLIGISEYLNLIPLICKDGHSMFTNYSKLKYITTNKIFDPSITNFSNCFEYCDSLLSIPEKLFEFNTEATNFSWCFSWCSSLTDISEILFKSNTKADDFTGCFHHCTSLTDIREKLFKFNTEVTDFSSCFAYCTSLTDIPEKLFESNTKATIFWNCFEYCTSLTSIPEKLFESIPDTKATNFLECFQNCYNIGKDKTKNKNVPELWNTHSKASGKNCFKGCSNAGNWNDIPRTWGGPETT